MLGRFTILSLVLVSAAAATSIACSKEPAPAAKAEAPKASAPLPTGIPEVKGGPEMAKPAAPEGKPKVEGQGFVVEVKAPSEVAAGQEGVAQVVLNATGIYHLNKDFPTKLDVTAPDGVTLAKTTFVIEDASKFEEKTATWDVKFTPAAAGEKKFGATFKFAVCTETTCDPKKEALAWTVPVK